MPIVVDNNPNKIEKYTDWVNEGMIPVWFSEQEEVDELLYAFLRVMMTKYLADIERIDGYKIENKINYSLQNYIKGWAINNFIDFREDTKLPLTSYFGEEEGINEYRKYILSRFSELIRYKGTEGVLKSLLSKLGISVDIYKYVKGMPGSSYEGIEIPEKYIIDQGNGIELWYSNPNPSVTRKWYPTAKVDIAYETIFSKVLEEGLYMYIPLDIFIDIEKAVRSVIPFHCRSGKIFIKVSGVIQNTSPFSSILQWEESSEGSLPALKYALKEETIVDGGNWNTADGIIDLKGADYYLTSVRNELVKEVPIGVVDGVNLNFRLIGTSGVAADILLNTIKIYINDIGSAIIDNGAGILSDGGSIDYTTGEIILAAGSEPLSASTEPIVVTYRTVTGGQLRYLVPGTYTNCDCDSTTLTTLWTKDVTTSSGILEFSAEKLIIGNNSVSPYLELHIYSDGKIVDNSATGYEVGGTSGPTEVTIKYTYKRGLMFRNYSLLTVRDRLRINHF